MSSGSSSESEDDERKKAMLKEAVFHIPITNTDKENNSKGQFKNKKSMRKFCTDEDSNQSEVLNANVKQFLGNKLFTFLDSEITLTENKTDGLTEENLKEKCSSAGIKLFKTSNSLIDNVTLDNKQKIMKPRKRKKYESSDSSSDDEERDRLKSAAVTFDFIKKNTGLLNGNVEKCKDKVT